MPLNRYSRYFLLLLCFFSTGVFAEEGKTSGFLSGLQQLRSTFGQDQEEQ